MFRSLEITFEAALRDLSDRSFQVRARAAHALRTCDEADRCEATAALVQVLGDARGEVRYAAARALGELGDRAALAALVPLLRDPDAQVREAATLALGQIGDAAAFQPLCEVLRTGSKEVRFQAAAALPALDPGGALAAPLLRQALADEDAEVRASAAAALAALPPDPQTADTLVALLSEAHPGPRVEAALSLGQLGDRRCVPALLQLLQGGPRALDAASALALVPDEQSREPLRAVLRRFFASPLLKAHCAYALAKLSPEEGRAHLLRASHSLRPDVRGLAEELLAAL